MRTVFSLTNTGTSTCLEVLKYWLNSCQGSKHRPSLQLVIFSAVIRDGQDLYTTRVIIMTTSVHFSSNNTSNKNRLPHDEAIQVIIETEDETIYWHTGTVHKRCRQEWNRNYWFSIVQNVLSEVSPSVYNICINLSRGRTHKHTRCEFSPRSHNIQFIQSSPTLGCRSAALLWVFLNVLTEHRFNSSKIRQWQTE